MGGGNVFSKRHPHLTLRTVEKLSYAHFVATNATGIDQYFDLLKDTFTDNELPDQPSHILVVMRLVYHLITHLM